MNDFEFFIRFGVHKDRETLKSLRDSMAGLVVPAHILCHSTNATIAAISYIKKSFYIDPMTFLYAGSDIKDYVVKDKETNADKFKPSIAKLTDDYGLTPTFQSNGYTALQPENFTEEFIDSFCDKNLKLQLKKVDESKEGAYKKYGDLLNKMGENHIVQEMSATHTPQGIVPPYFYFNSLNDPWLEVNLNLAKTTKEKAGQDLVTPLIFTNTDTLGTALLDKYTDYSQLFIWIDDLDEKKSNGRDEQVVKLKKLADFIKEAKEKNKKVINICGSYYSIMLGKLGLAGMCNGIFYGEFRAKKSKIGGAPQARYYIRDVHEFFGIPETIALLKKYPTLQDKDCQKCLDLVVDGKIDNIIAFSAEHALAQAHFVYTREKEIEVMKKSSLSNLRDDLEAKHIEWATKIPDPKITSKTIEHLAIWKDALSSYQ